MINKKYKQFYFISLLVLFALSAYPLVNGTYMAYLSIANGAITPEQYAKYVVPYTAMCLAAILFAALQPLLFRAGRLALPAGLAGAYGVFIALEQFFERIQVHTTGMALIDTASLSTDQPQNIAATTIDMWQASLCVVSPLTRGQAIAYTSQDRYVYVMANGTYKIHYYLIALILITMVCGLIYGIGRMLRSGDRSKSKALMLQGLSTALLLTLCVFANTTAFFRQAAAIQTPLASVLTCIFFIVLGTTVGCYAGSFLLRKRKSIGIGLPVLMAVAAVTLMYVGEAAMMDGNLYRFGAGWFFEPLPGLPPAPVDLLVIMLSGGVTWLILSTVRKKEHWPGRRTAIAMLTACFMVTASGVAFSMDAPDTDEDIFGCYEFDECLYMNPLSSFIAVKGFMPYIYGLGRDSLIIANTETGVTEQMPAHYEKTPVAADELISKADIVFESFRFPNLAHYKERWLRAVFTGRTGQQYGLYQMDGEVWLVTLNNSKLWSIYKLQKTAGTSLADLERALRVQDSTPTGLPQLTLTDVYELARKGQNLTLRDFEHFDAKAAGSDFVVRRYDVKGGCALLVHSDTPDSNLNYARLSKRGYNAFDENLTVDIRAGVQEVAAYLNPLHSPVKFKLEDSHSGTNFRELIYEYDGYRYYLNTTRADQVFITPANGERLPLKQALTERRLVIEDAVASGLYNVFMEPVDNPLGGGFPILHHRHTFTFNHEEFYPSASFLYMIDTDHLTTYFDIVELADILTLQARNELAAKLHQTMSTDNLPAIAGKTYITVSGLAAVGITVDIGWSYSSHTPVSFTAVDN